MRRHSSPKVQWSNPESRRRVGIRAPICFKPRVEQLEDRLAPNNLVGLTLVGSAACSEATAEVACVNGDVPPAHDVWLASPATLPVGDLPIVSVHEASEPPPREAPAAPSDTPADAAVPPAEDEVVLPEIAPLEFNPFAEAEALFAESALEHPFGAEAPEAMPPAEYVADAAVLDAPRYALILAYGDEGPSPDQGNGAAAHAFQGEFGPNASVRDLTAIMASRLTAPAAPAATAPIFVSPGFPEEANLLAQGFVQIVWQGQQALARPNEWLVSFQGVTGSAAAQLAQINGLLAQASPGAVAIDHLGGDGMVLVRTAAGTTYAALSAALAGVAEVDHLEPNFAVWSTATPNDPSFGSLWGLQNTAQSGGKAGADIGAVAAWDLSTGNSANPVVIAVIDTGIDFNHPDLQANIWVNPFETAGNGKDDDGNGFADDLHGWNFVNNTANVMDDNGHGTHVAGTIAAVGNNDLGVVGVNWNAQLMALKFLDRNGSGTTANAVKALNYATWMKNNGVNVLLSNNSWGGGGYSSTLYNAIQASRNAGMLFVAAAGNSGTNQLSYPAAYNLDNVIAVAATDRNDNLASFSNYGSWVHLAAPGVAILSTTPNNTYSTYSGTSMASPHVAGVAALAWAYNPTASYTQVRDAILQSVDPVASLAGKTATGGRLNGYQTLQTLGPPPTTAPAAPADLTATAVSSSQISLNWTDASDNEAGFLIERATDSGFTSGLTSVTVRANSTSYLATGLAASTTYFFRVRALNAIGSSDDSNTASAQTPALPTRPNPPANLTATAVSGSQIILNWTDASDNETGFIIERATNSSFTSGLTRVTVAADSTSYQATGLAVGTTYYFRVRAVNAVGNSANSNTASARTLAPPTAPASLTAKASSSSQINLKWTDRSSNETGFVIERLVGTTWVVIATVEPNVTSFQDTGLAARRTYYYRIRAINDIGRSAASNAAGATTLR